MDVALSGKLPPVKSSEFLAKGDQVICVGRQFPEGICLCVTGVHALTGYIDVNGGNYGSKTVHFSDLVLLNRVTDAIAIHLMAANK